jgi:hypothetical protein
VSNTAIADAAGISCSALAAAEPVALVMDKIHFGSPPGTNAGLYDGIYLWSDGNYLSLHQDGTDMIATNYFNDNGSFNFKTATGDVLTIPQLDLFDLLSGPVTVTKAGATAKIKGTKFHRACDVTYDFTFSGSTLTATRTGVSNTAAAEAAGISCSAIVGTESPTITPQRQRFAN